MYCCNYVAKKVWHLVHDTRYQITCSCNIFCCHFISECLHKYGRVVKFSKTLLLPYFTCESIGQNGDRDCQVLLHEVETNYLPFNQVISGFILIGLLTAVTFVFSTNFRKCFAVVKKMKHPQLSSAPKTKSSKQ